MRVRGVLLWLLAVFAIRLQRTCALRKCCSDPKAVLVSYNDTETVSCHVPRSSIAPFIWAPQEQAEKEGAGPPPLCRLTTTGQVSLWVLHPLPPPPTPMETLQSELQTFENDTQDATIEVPVDVSPELPPLWQHDARRFCADVLVIGQEMEKEMDVRYVTVAVDCAPDEPKSGGEDAREASSYDAGAATVAGGNVTSDELQWAQRKSRWTDVLYEEDAGGPAPWSAVTLRTGDSVSDSFTTDVSTVPEVAAQATLSLAVDPRAGAAVLRKCCPRGQGVHVGGLRCAALQNGAIDFPSFRTLTVIAQNETEKEAPSLSVVTVGAAQGLEGWTGSVACPKNTVRVFQRVTRIVVRAAQYNASLGQEVAPEAAALCVDGDAESSSAVVARCEPRGVACRASGQRACVSKCCPLGHSFQGRSCRRSDEPLPLHFKVSFADAPPPRTVALMEGRPKCRQFFYLRPESKADDVWHLQADGRVFRPVMSRLYPLEGYCMEHLNYTNSDGEHLLDVRAFVCFPSKEKNKYLDFELSVVFPMRAAALLLSSAALALTLAAYCLLPPLRNLHGKTVMAQATSMLGTFLFLAAAQLLSLMQLRAEVCKAIGYLLLFWLLTNFTWLNVLSFDIWWTFGALRGHRETRGRARDRRRFLWYSLYAWGAPLLFFSVAVAINERGEAWGVHFNYRPNIAKWSCFLVRGTMSRVVYLQIPAALMVGVNVVLFMLTARRCSRIKAEMARLTGGKQADSFCSTNNSQCHSNGRANNGMGDEGPQPQRRMTKFRADCERFLMNAKLFIAMGVPWAVDVISDFIIEPKWVWYVPEALLSLQGVFIFCIFVLKRKVLVRLRRRLFTSPCFRCCCPDVAAVNASDATITATASTQRGTRRSLVPSAGTNTRLAPASANKQVFKSASSSTLCTLTTTCGGGGELVTQRNSPSPTLLRNSHAER